MRSFLCCLLLPLASLLALEVPPVPDPVGLGERLAIIDYLKDHHVTAPAGATDEALQSLYRQAWLADPARATMIAAENAKAAAVERVKILRKIIIDTYGVTPDASLDEVGLRHLKEKLEVARAEAKAREIDALIEADRQRHAAGLDAAPVVAAVANPEPTATPASTPAPVTKRQTEAAMEVASTAGLGRASDTGSAIPAVAAKTPGSRAPGTDSVYGAKELMDLSEFSVEKSANWANWGNVPLSTRDSCSVKCFLKVGDRSAYYILINDRGGVGDPLVAEISGERFPIARSINVGLTVVVLKPRQWNSSPEITLYKATK